MLELIDKQETIRTIYDRFCAGCYKNGQCTGCEYEYCIGAVEEVPAISSIDRAGILQLCNEIENIAQDIKARTLSDSYAQAQCIIDKARQIGKELTEDETERTD